MLRFPFSYRLLTTKNAVNESLKELSMVAPYVKSIHHCLSIFQKK